MDGFKLQGIAFILNLSFAVFEFFGGVFTGSVAILSDAVHDNEDQQQDGSDYNYFFQRKRNPGYSIRKKSGNDRIDDNRVPLAYLDRKSCSQNKGEKYNKDNMSMPAPHLNSS